MLSDISCLRVYGLCHKPFIELIFVGGVVIIKLINDLCKPFGPLAKRLANPLSNRKASSLGRIFGTIMTTFLIVIFLSWFVMKGSSIYVQSRANTICNRFVDAIAENGKVTVAMQRELFKDFGKLKYFTGDYKVQFLVYDYSNPGAKISLGTSNNGTTIPETTVARGKIVQVNFISEETALDKMTKFANPGGSSAGLTAFSAAKVD